MSNVIKKIFEGNCDNDVHEAFLKFGRGVYKYKYLVEGKKQKDKRVIKTSAEFANMLVKLCLEGISGKVKMEGLIVSTFDLRKEKGYLFEEGEKVKSFMGIKQLVVNSEVDVHYLKEIMAKYPRAFYALSFKIGDEELKIKQKAPKSAKPSTKGEGEVKADFCSLKTSKERILKEIFFDIPEFKEAKVIHTIEINEIEIPKGESDPVMIREMSKRKGKVIRKMIIDGKEEIREKDFLA